MLVPAALLGAVHGDVGGAHQLLDRACRGAALSATPTEAPMSMLWP
jgi:hypothetical protein